MIVGIIAILLMGLLSTYLLYCSDEKKEDLQHQFNLELLTLDPIPTEYIKTKDYRYWILMPVLTFVFLIVLVLTALAVSNSINKPNLTNNIIAQKQKRIWPAFTASVQYWNDKIIEWAETYNLDPNMIATVMQIESCGDATAISPAGAQGLFQVMPFHFAAGENTLDIDTNAHRGLLFLQQQLATAKERGNELLAFAAYNGGGSIFNKPYDNWPNETKRYYSYAQEIYNKDKASDGIMRWLQSGGESLCNLALTHIQ